MIEFTIAGRFNGPPGMVNGGFLAGSVSDLIGNDIELTLRRPAPLDTEMTLVQDEKGDRVMHGDVLVATAGKTDIEFNAPDTPSFEEAVKASKKYIGLREHPFPTCFVCGPHRHSPDGLCLFPGPIGKEFIAAPWIPHRSFDTGDGTVMKEILWSVLDCPSGIVLMDDTFRPVVTGKLAARIEKPVAVEEKCVVIAWVNGHDSRKHSTGSALYSESGELRAVAKATWIDI